MTDKHKLSSRAARIVSSMKGSKGVPAVLHLTASSSITEELVRLNERVAVIEDLKVKVGELSAAVVAVTATVNHLNSEMGGQRFLTEKLAKDAQQVEERLAAQYNWTKGLQDQLIKGAPALSSADKAVQQVSKSPSKKKRAAPKYANPAMLGWPSEGYRESLEAFFRTLRPSESARLAHSLRALHTQWLDSQPSDAVCFGSDVWPDETYEVQTPEDLHEEFNDADAVPVDEIIRLYFIRLGVAEDPIDGSYVLYDRTKAVTKR